MRPLKLHAEGFQGIRQGLGLDRLDVDLSNLEGVVALTGDNGRGKSTFLGLLQPWPWLPDHGGDIYRQVHGPAVKELEFEVAGEAWKSVVVVDPRKKRTKAELLMKNGEGWIPAEVDGIRSTGTMKTYLALLERIICPPDLFFRAAFRAQNARSLAQLSPAEAKSVFVSALDLPLIEEIGKKASRVKNALADRASVHEEQAETLKKEIEALTAKLEKAKTLELQIPHAKRNLAEARKAHERAMKDLAEARAKAVAMKEAQQRYDASRKRLKEARERKTELESEIKKAELDAEKKTKDAIKSIDEAKTTLGREEKARAAERRLKDAEKLLAEMEKESEKVRKEAADLDETRKSLAEMEKSLGKLLARMEYLKQRGQDLNRSAKVLDQVPCAGDTKDACPLLSEARKAATDIEPMRKEYKKLRAETEELEKSIEETKKKLVALDAVEEKVKILDKKVRDKRKEIDDLRREAAILPLMEEAKKRLKESESRLDEIRKERDQRIVRATKEISRISEEISNLEKELASHRETKVDLAPLEKTLDAAARDVMGAEKRLTTLRESLAAMKASEEILAAKKEELHRVDDKASLLRQRSAHFNTLSKAFSKNGIVALEIEDAGPFLTAEANALLQDCMGGRFTVNIRLLAETANGNGTKETFEILVHDSRSPDGEPKLLGDLSGGEAAVVEPAVTHALALLNTARAKGRLLAAFSDESLSRLSPWNRLEAFEAFRRFHQRGGFQVSFLVTHEEDIWSRCDCVLTFKEGGIEGLED